MLLQVAAAQSVFLQGRYAQICTSSTDFVGFQLSLVASVNGIK